MRIALIAFGVCFPVLVNTVAGVRAVSPGGARHGLDAARRRMERVLRIYLPAALPSIAAGLRIALSIGLVLVVISEFAGEGGGLGHYILVQQGQFAVPEMYAGILFLGLLGYALNLLFLLVERRVLAWHYGASGEPAADDDGDRARAPHGPSPSCGSRGSESATRGRWPGGTDRDHLRRRTTGSCLLS